MERNTKTIVNNLAIGDRFLKVNDKKKEVWEKVPHEAKQTKYQTYSHFAKRDYERFPSAMKSDTQVIFLRNKMQNHDLLTKANHH
ncbi:MAG TPA: hypothetical protein VIQ00_02895 [Chitinophagaceae bacterium]